MNASEWMVPILGIGGSILIAAVTYYFTNKSKIRFQELELKEKRYSDFVHALSSYANNTNNNEALNTFVICMNNLSLVCSADVADTLKAFQDYIARKDESYCVEEQDKLFSELLKAMRKDLYGEKFNKGFPNFRLRANNK